MHLVCVAALLEDLCCTHSNALHMDAEPGSCLGIDLIARSHRLLQIWRSSKGVLCSGAGQESETPEPEGPSTGGRSRYRASPTLRGLPPLQLQPPEAGASPDVSFSEGAVSPREQEAAQQMQALHQGVGAYTGFGREGPPVDQVTGPPSMLNPAYGVPIGFPQQELEAEREEYEDDNSEADDM